MKAHRFQLGLFYITELQNKNIRPNEIGNNESMIDLPNDSESNECA